MQYQSVLLLCNVSLFLKKKIAERTHKNLTFNRWESVDGLNALALLLFKSAIDRLSIYTLYSMIQVQYDWTMWKDPLSMTCI